VYPNASAPIRAMPISASFLLASSRRFATWTSSVISVPFGAHRSPPGLPRPAPRRSLGIFYRFTVEEAIENGDRAYAALDRTARGQLGIGDRQQCAAGVMASP
jgi:hypothetical protein